MSDPGIPSSKLPLATRAPGKCILFGEHAVVHGKPEVVLAIDLHTQVALRGATEHRLNGSAEAARSNAYLVEGLRRLHPDGPPLDVTVTSRLPRAAGLGSSAAFTSALSAGLWALRGGVSRAELAASSFEVERGAQGVGSPGDTTATVGGGYLSINAGTGPAAWTVRDGDREWAVRRLPDPQWVWVVGYTGIPRNTGETVRAVGRRLDQSDGPALLDRFQSVALEGVDALREERREAVGRLLDQNQALLREVGVSHPRVEALLAAAAPGCDGGKLTGAGAGGSVVVLPKPGHELEVARRIARAGGVPYIVKPAPLGVQLVEHLGVR
ncbi:MAG: mevalonate kinase [Thermoplasmata archaeon]|nr:mevalonate kinase [Thermoplasmata archaeon]